MTAVPALAPLEDLIREAAREELVARFRRTARELKADGTWVTAADLAMQARLKSALAARHPEIGFLGEEMDATEQDRMMAASCGAGLWVLDPLDGTNNFAAGIPLFGVSLALLRAGRIVAGIVYDPMHDESFAATIGGGATLNGAALRAQPAGIPIEKTTACIDFKRLPPQLAARIAATPP
jgi:myo-inositol-1(or 4)-monophosphatase